MIKKISLTKKDDKIIGGYILIPSSISKELGWFDNTENIHLEYKDDKLTISSVIEDKENKNIEDGKLIIFNKNTKIIRGKKYYKNSVYITEKIYLPINITKELSKNFSDLKIIIKSENNDIIVEAAKNE